MMSLSPKDRQWERARWATPGLGILRILAVWIPCQEREDYLAEQASVLAEAPNLWAKLRELRSSLLGFRRTTRELRRFTVLHTPTAPEASNVIADAAAEHTDADTDDWWVVGESPTPTSSYEGWSGYDPPPDGVYGAP